MQILHVSILSLVARGWQIKVCRYPWHEGGAEGGDKGCDHSRNLDKCVNVSEANRQGMRRCSCHTTCGDEDGEARGEGAHWQDGEMQQEAATWQRAACLHSAGRDGELLQIQPVLPAAAAQWVLVYLVCELWWCVWRVTLSKCWDGNHDCYIHETPNWSQLEWPRIIPDFYLDRIYNWQFEF